LPQYRMAKSLVQGWSDTSADSDLTPVLVLADSGWQLGYRVEDLGDGWVTVFLPQAPTPMSGNIVYLPATELRSTAMTMIEATEIIRRLGAGSAIRMKEIDLGAMPPAVDATAPRSAVDPRPGPALRTRPDTSAAR
jgi:hypothetical protein